MVDEMLKYQCPACGAPLHFSPEKQMLACDSCDSTFPKDLFKKDEPEEEKEMTKEEADAADQAVESHEKIDWRTESVASNKPAMENQTAIVCTSCGAEVISDGTTAATECVYCGNPVVLTENVTGVATPDFVIPFKIDKNQAKEKLLDFYKGKKLLPDAFRDANRIEKIAGVYVPFWLFSCKGSGDIRFRATKTKSWSDSNYNYTKTSYYAVERAGEIGFDKIPVDASKKMDDNYMDGIEPYNYDELAEFKSMYMAGYLADKYDVSVDESTARVNTRVVNSVEDNFKKTVTGYSSVTKTSSQIDMHGEDINYALFPVWMLNTKYNGEMYQFAINGQTGLVSGKLPIDKNKVTKYFLKTMAMVAVPIGLIAGIFFF